MSDPIGPIWAWKSGENQPTNFAGTNAGIQAAIDYCGSSGGAVAIGAGTYSITTTLTISNSLKLVGAGTQKTILSMAGTGPCVKLAGAHASNYWMTIEDLKILGDNTQTGIAMLVDNASFVFLKNLYFRDIKETALSFNSTYDSYIENVFIEECGDTTHSALTITCDTTASNSSNRIIFWDLHVENSNAHDATMVDLVGNATNQVQNIEFYSIKLHGSPSTGYPQRPLYKEDQYTVWTRFYGGVVAFGNGTAQMEFSSSGRSHIDGIQFGLDTSHPAARGIHFKNGPHSFSNIYMVNSDSYTTAAVRFDSGTNNCVGTNVFLASGGTPVSDGGTGNFIMYRDPAQTGFRLYCGSGNVYFAQAPILGTDRIFATGTGSNGHLVPNAGGTDYSFLLDTLGQSPTFGTATATTNVLTGNLDLSNSSIIRMKDTGGTYRNVLLSSASNLIKIIPLAAGQAVRFNNFADNATNFEVAEGGQVSMGRGIFAYVSPPTLADNTTPTVAGGNIFKCSPVGATNITSFTNAVAGQMIVLIFTNGNATIKAGAAMKLVGGLDFVGTADDTLTLVYDGSTFWEQSRSVNA